MRKVVITVLLTMAITFTIFIWLINSETGVVLKYWTQPKSVDYGKSLYILSFMRVDKKLNFLESEIFLVGGKSRKYFFVVSKNQTKPELYFMLGHYKLYALNEYNKYRAKGNKIDIISYLEECEVIWANNGISIIEPSGHKLFIPKSSFINKR